MAGKTIVFRFDDSDVETRTAAGAISCSPIAITSRESVTGSRSIQAGLGSKGATCCPHISATYGLNTLDKPSIRSE